MNAEVFENIEGRIDFDRVCNLRIGDKAIVNGIWKQVYFINRHVIKFHLVGGKGKYVSSLARHSKQFVQVVKK